MVTTVGASPKKIAATITALVVPYIVGFAADKAGLTIDVGTATAIAGPLVLAACTFVAAHLAGPGNVHVDMDQGLYYPDPYTGPNPPAKVAPTVPEAVPEKKPKPKPRRKPAKS